MRTPDDLYIQVGGINTRYWTAGSQGAYIILVHGIRLYVETWLPCFDSLARQYHVYAVDLPGHGRTDKPLDTSYKITDLAQFVKDFMTALGIEKAHIIGHSLGGAIGTRLTLLHPAVVDKLILVASAGLGQEGTAVLRTLTLPLLGEILTRPRLSRSAALAKLLFHHPDLMTSDMIELDYQLVSLPGWQPAFLKALRANGTFFGQRKSMYGPNVQGLPSIINPVLVVWGQQDQVVPVAHTEVAAKGLPYVRVKILDNCGHLPMLEHTQAFNELILEFLGQ